MKEKLLRGIQQGQELLALRTIIVSYQEAGMTQQAAAILLEAIRQAFQQSGEEDQEDLVLELMDFMAGWCQPKWKIWSDGE